MENGQTILNALSAILVLGIVGQWIAWRLRLPSILVLLVFGFLAGPVGGLLDPDALFGRDLLFPLVSAGVALILFEGGLSLRLGELRHGGPMIRNLVTLGAAASWVLGALGAHWLLGFPVGKALLLGAILICIGPTVIGPLLRQIQPADRVGAIAKWEGIVIDPLSAILAVLTFEAFRWGAPEGLAAGQVAIGLVETLLVGLAIGGAVGWAMLLALRRYWIPEYLQSPMLLMAVVAAFSLSNLLRHDSGLLTVTLMGVVMANQASVRLRHVAEFKENLRELLIGAMFIVLAARIRLADFSELSWSSGLFVVYLVLIVRPAAVLVSAWGSGLNWRELLFLGWLAPRGIVAAAVASVFALQLGPDGRGLAPVTFLVIFATVLLYGLTAAPLSRRLGIASPNPQGILIVGANGPCREIARLLKELGFRVMLLDNTRENIRAARLEGLEAVYANALSENAINNLDLGGIGRMLAMTGNDEVNSLAALHFRAIFGLESVFQLPIVPPEPRSVPIQRQEPRPPEARKGDGISHQLQGRPLFAATAGYGRIAELHASGAVAKRTPLSAEFDFDAFRARYGDRALPLFVIDEHDALQVLSAEDTAAPLPGQTLISLALPPEDEAKA